MPPTIPFIKRLILTVLSLTLCLTALPTFSQTQPSNETRELPPNQTIERELTGAETHRYHINLTKDEFFQVRVEQKGVDMSLRLLDASGHVLATMDSPNSKQGPETLSYVAAQSGGFTLEVSGLDAKAEKGNYSILREISRTATAKDRRRVEVERLFVEGLTARNTEGQAETAIAKLEDALKGWRELGDSYLTDLTEQQVKAIRLQPKIKALIAELGVPNSLSVEGNKLIREGKPESVLAARAKFTEALAAARKLFKRLDGDDLSDILSKDNRADLKTNARMDEVNALRSISNTYDALKDWQESVNYNKQVIAVIREMQQDPEISASRALTYYIPLKAIEASSLYSIGTTLTSNLDKPQEGLSYDNQALTLWREVQHENEKYRAYAEYQEASTLQTMAQSYLILDDRNKAIECFEQALAIFRRLPDQKSLAASILLQLGNVYSRQLDYEKARGAWDEALKIYEGLGDRREQADVLGQIGLSYFNVNDEQTAREYFNRELAILLSDDYLESAMKENSTIPLPDSKAEPTNVSLFYKNNFEWQRSINIGNIYLILKDNGKGREHYEKSLTSARAVKNQTMIRLSLYFIGKTYEQEERWQEALDYYSQELRISRLLPSKSDLAGDLLEVAFVNIQLKRWPDALQSASEALLIYQSLGADKNNLFSGYSGALNLMARTQDGLGNRRLAIFYEKQAVNAIQRERQQLKNLDQQAQRGYLKKSEKPYQRLAEWLIAEGRLLEAEQVSQMLKEEEVFSYLRLDASEADKFQQRTELTPEERSALTRYNAVADNLAALGTEFGKLQELRSKGRLTEAQEQLYKDRTIQLADASRGFEVFLRQLAEEFAKHANSEKDLQENLALKEDLKSLGAGVVFLYTFVGDDRYRVILVTPDTQVDGKYEITAVNLNEKIEAFRQAVKDPTADPHKPGKELYDILIKPIEKQLADAHAKTLLWSLDGNLRLLPLAALWDGKQYFGQKYQNVTVTLSSRIRLGEPIKSSWRALALGVSEAKKVEVKELGETRALQFPPLPFVKTELRSIVRSRQSPNGILPGQSLLDDEFNESALEDQLARGYYNVIHIASHVALNPGDVTSSVLLLGDGSILTVDEMRHNPRLRFSGVELLTLSACNTAVVGKDSSGKEIEGFGYVAQQNGAKAILATLWSVADKSTQLLMREFYRLRKERPQLTKAAALQLAQQEMIEGKLQPSRAAAQQRGLRTAVTNAAYDPQRPYAHPYYWSPFILIGNWR